MKRFYPPLPVFGGRQRVASSRQLLEKTALGEDNSVALFFSATIPLEEKKYPMEDVKTGIVGVQLTLVGLFLMTIFEGVYPYPLVGLLLGAVGTSVVAVAAFDT